MWLESIYAATGRVVGATGAATPCIATVGGVDASYMVSCNVLVTTATSHSFSITCTYTDEGNTSRTLTLMTTLVAGGPITGVVNTNGAVPYMGIPQQIRAKAGTTITIASTGTFTTVVYNIDGRIILLGN